MGSIEGALKVCVDVLRATELNNIESEEFALRSLLVLVSLLPLLTPAEPSWLNALTP